MAEVGILEFERYGTVPRPMSEKDFVTWALNHELRSEWLDGQAHLMSPVSLKQVQISGWLQQTLGIYIADRRLGVLLGPQLMVRLQSEGRISRRVPDLLFVRSANRHALQPNQLEGPPDFVIEIVSQDSIARDWREKFLEYEAAGVLEYWIIDPLTDTFEASVRNLDGKFVKVGLDASGVVHSATVPGFWLKPEWLWQFELPDPIQHLRDLGALS